MGDWPSFLHWLEPAVNTVLCRLRHKQTNNCRMQDTPPIAKITCVKNSRAKVFCGMIFFNEKDREIAQPIQPISTQIGLDWLCCLAEKSQMAPKIFFIFSPQNTFVSHFSHIILAIAGVKTILYGFLLKYCYAISTYIFFEKYWHNLQCAHEVIFQVLLSSLPLFQSYALSFYRSQNFLCQTKILFTYCGSHKHFVPDKKMICIQ